MRELFDLDRGPDGWPKFGAVGPPEPTPLQAHRMRCYANGVTDPADVEALWREELAKLKPKPKKRKGAQRDGRK